MSSMYLLGFGFGLDFSIRPPRGCRHIFAFLSSRVCTCSRTYVSDTQARSSSVCLYNQKISIGSWHQIKTRTFLRRILLCSRSSDRSSQISEKLRSIVGNMYRKQLFRIIRSTVYYKNVEINGNRRGWVLFVRSPEKHRSVILDVWLNSISAMISNTYIYR